MIKLYRLEADGRYIDTDYNKCESPFVVASSDYDALAADLKATDKMREDLFNQNQRLRYARGLLDRAVDTMTALHRCVEPMDDSELAGRVPPQALRAFVDALAEIDRERCASFLGSSPQNKLSESP